MSLPTKAEDRLMVASAAIRGMGVSLGCDRDARVWTAGANPGDRLVTVVYGEKFVGDPDDNSVVHSYTPNQARLLGEALLKLADKAGGVEK